MSNREIDVLSMEKEYFEKHPSQYQIGELILESTPRWEIYQLRVEAEDDYFVRKNVCITELNHIKKGKVYLSGSEIERYFIEKVYYYFSNLHLIEETLPFITKLENYYNIHYWNQYWNKKKIDFNWIDIVEFLSRFIKVPSNLNKNFPCVFPDHKEKTWSFRVYQKTNSFFCFGCHRGGKSVQFLQYFYWIEKSEAVKKVIKIYS